MYPVAQQILLERALDIIQNKKWTIDCCSPIDFDVLMILVDLGKVKMDYDKLSRNIYLTLNFVLSNMDKNWNWFYLSINKNLSSLYPNFSIEDILAHKNLPWNWSFISHHPDLTVKHIFEHADIVWNMPIFCEFGKITEEDLLKAPNNPIWIWDCLSYNKNISAEFLISHFDYKNLDWSALSEKVNWEFFQQNLDFPWKRNGLAQNPNIPFEEKMKWNCNFSSISLTITSLDTVLQYPNYPWDWLSLSLNYNISIKDILKHKHFDWEWKSLCGCKEIYYQDMINNPDIPWYDKTITLNKYVYMVSENECIEHVKKILAANKIKRAWFIANTNPEYLICQKRLKIEFALLL